MIARTGWQCPDKVVASVTIELTCAPVAEPMAEMRVETRIMLPKRIPTGTAGSGHVESVATRRPDMKLSTAEAIPSMTWT